MEETFAAVVVLVGGREEKRVLFWSSVKVEGTVTGAGGGARGNTAAMVLCWEGLVDLVGIVVVGGVS